MIKQIPNIIDNLYNLTVNKMQFLKGISQGTIEYCVKGVTEEHYNSIGFDISPYYSIITLYPEITLNCKII